MSEAATTVRAVRLIVARCEVVYTGRLNAVLPVSTRLLMLKSDGSVLVHADSGGYKPSNWMTAPTVIEEQPGLMVVRKRAGATEDRLEIRIAEVISDVTHDMGEAAALEKEGVERELRDLLQLAGGRPHPHHGRDRKADRLRIDLGAIARDHPGALEPLDALTYRRRREVDPPAELGHGDPGVGLQFLNEATVDRVKQLVFVG